MVVIEPFPKTEVFDSRGWDVHSFGSYYHDYCNIASNYGWKAIERDIKTQDHNRLKVIHAIYEYKRP